MSQDEFTRIFAYMSERFDRIDDLLTKKADQSGMDRVLKILDGHTKQLEVANDERLVMGYQLSKLEQRLDSVL